MKLKLNELKLQSFVTSLEEAHQRTVVGGDATADWVSCNPATQQPTGYPCQPCGGNPGTNYCNPSTSEYCTGSGAATGYACQVQHC